MIKFFKKFSKKVFIKRAILFHIDEEARDTVVAKSFANVSKSKNHLMIFSSRLTSKLYKFFRIDNFLDNIIVPKPYFIDLYTKDYKKRVFSLLPTEALGHLSYSKEGILDHFVPFGPNADEKKISTISNVINLHFLWGEDVAKSVEELSPIKKAKLYTVGHPRYFNHDCSKSKKKPVDISRERKLRIGFSSRFDSLNSYNFRQSSSLIETIIFNESCMKWLRKEEIEAGIGIKERLYKDIQDIRNMFQIIEALKENSRIDILFRPHPREDIYNWKNIAKRFNSKKIKWCLDITKQSFTNWLNDIDIIISPPSTTFYDCMFLGVYPISTAKLVKNRKKLLNYHWDDTNKINKFIKCPSTIDELLDLIEDISSSYNEYVPNFWSQEKINSVNGEVDFLKSKNSVALIIETINKETPNHKLGLIRFLYIYPIIFIVEFFGCLGNFLLFLIKQRSSSYFFFSLKERFKIYK